MERKRKIVSHITKLEHVSISFHNADPSITDRNRILILLSGS